MVVGFRQICIHPLELTPLFSFLFVAQEDSTEKALLVAV